MDLNKDLKDVRFNVDLSTFLIIYRQYKSYFVPVVIILVSILLFFVILIPQVQAVLNAREQEAAEMQKLNILKQSYNNISTMNEATLAQNADSLTRALPSSKDFAGIINSISSNSVKSGVAVGNFEFSVGDLSTSQEGVVYPSIQISLNVNGSPKATLDFIKNLYNSVPVTEVTSVKLSGETTSLKAVFYYKAYPPVSLDSNNPIAPFNSEENTLIEKITDWSDSVSADLLPLSIGLEENDQLSSTDSARTSPFQ